LKGPNVRFDALGHRSGGRSLALSHLFEQSVEREQISA
jgi:hypothetical protein